MPNKRTVLFVLNKVIDIHRRLDTFIVIVGYKSDMDHVWMSDKVFESYMNQPYFWYVFHQTIWPLFISVLCHLSLYMCRKLQIHFCASAVCPRRVRHPCTSYPFPTSLILSSVVREIVEKPCSSKDANSGLLLDLNHQLQTVPVVKWIKVPVVAIWSLLLISLIPHLNQKKLNVSNCFIENKSLFVFFWHRDVMCTHGCFLGFHFFETLLK